MLNDGTEADGRKEGQRPHDDHGADEQKRKVRPETGKLPTLWGMVFLPARLPARASTGTISRKRPMSMRQPQGQVIPGGVGRQAREGAAVVAETGGEGIEDFAEAVRPGIIQGLDGPTR